MTLTIAFAGVCVCVRVCLPPADLTMSEFAPLDTRTALRVSHSNGEASPALVLQQQDPADNANTRGPMAASRLSKSKSVGAHPSTGLRAPPTSPCKLARSWDLPQSAVSGQSTSEYQQQRPTSARSVSTNTTGTNTPGRMVSAPRRPSNPLRKLRTVGSGPDLLSTAQQPKTITVSRRRPASARSITTTRHYVPAARGGARTPTARTGFAGPLVLPARQRALSDTKENAPTSRSLSVRLSAQAHASAGAGARRAGSTSPAVRLSEDHERRGSGGSAPAMLSVPATAGAATAASVGAVGRTLARAAAGISRTTAVAAATQPASIASPPAVPIVPAALAAGAGSMATATAGGADVQGAYKKRRRSPPLARGPRRGPSSASSALDEAASTPPPHPPALTTLRGPVRDPTTPSPIAASSAAAVGFRTPPSRHVVSRSPVTVPALPADASAVAATAATVPVAGGGAGAGVGVGSPVRTARTPRAKMATPRTKMALTPSTAAHRRAKSRSSADGSPGDGSVTPVKEFVVVESSALARHHDPDGAMDNVVLPALRSADWAARYEAIEVVRQLVTFDPHAVLPHLAVVLPAVTEAVTSIRSAMARNAIFCVADMFAGLRGAMELDLRMTATVLLRRAAHDKGFLRDAANAALKAMVEQLATENTLAILTSFAKHRSAGVCGRAAHFADLCVGAMTADMVRSLDLSDVLVASSRYVCGKSADSRAAARRLIRRVVDVVGVRTLHPPCVCVECVCLCEGMHVCGALCLCMDAAAGDVAPAVYGAVPPWPHHSPSLRLQVDSLEASIRASPLSRADADGLVRLMKQPKRRLRATKSCLRDRIKQRRRQMSARTTRDAGGAAAAAAAAGEPTSQEGGVTPSAGQQQQQ